jgi:transcriptional regulator with XRE-family HTH domain
MKKIQNTKGLGKKIRELRVQNSEKFSQEQIANLLWISRVVLWNIESWERDLKKEELMMLSDIFEVPFSYFVEEDRKIKKLNKDDQYYNFKRILLYILNKVWDKPNISKTVVYKLLYFSEFNYFEKYWESLIGIDFIKWPRWPVPKNADEIFTQMANNKQLEQITTLYKWSEQYKLISKLKDIDFDDLSYSQIKIIDDVLEKLWNKTAKEISDYSHGDTPYVATKNIWDVINKWLVFNRSSDYSVGERGEVEKDKGDGDLEKGDGNLDIKRMKGRVVC